MSISAGELLNVSNQSHLHGSTAAAEDSVFHWIPSKVEVSKKTEMIARAQSQNKSQHISMFCYSKKMKLYQLRFLPGLVCKTGDMCRLDFKPSLSQMCGLGCDVLSLRTLMALLFSPRKGVW